MKYNNIENLIIQCLKNSWPKDLSINEIAKTVKLNRLTVSKYVAVLQARGIVILSRSVGKAKMFQLAPEHIQIAIADTGEEGKRKIKVQFRKKFLHYKPWETALLDEEEAREYIRAGYAQEVTS